MGWREWFQGNTSQSYQSFGKKELRKILIGIGIATFLVICVATALGVNNMRYVKNVVRDQFNEEQLILARTSAQRIERSFHHALSDLVFLSTFPAIQYADRKHYEHLLALTLPILKKDFITEIVRIKDNGKKSFVVDIENGLSFGEHSFAHDEPAIHMSVARDVSLRGKAIPLETKNVEKDGNISVWMTVIVPIYEDAIDAEHPYPSRRFAGYLRASIDLTDMIKSVLSTVQSGKTGYSWAIDHTGTFLYHPEDDFIGENAFEARTRKNPNIFFIKINEIQKREMLQGKEGVGSYISGWHREIVAPMEKLIAYSPVKIVGLDRTTFWSVAVVAPIHEIEGVVSRVYARQIILQGMVLCAILLASLFMILYEFRWLSILETEVTKKTEDIKAYARELEQSEAKYRSLVESAEDIIFSVDGKGVIRTANPSTNRLFGIPENISLAKKSISEIFPGDKTEEQQRIIESVISSGKSFRTEETLVVGNHTLWLHFNYIPIKSGEDSPLVLVIGRDMTDWKQIENQLINTEKLASLGTLAAGVAHELNNPLGIMLGFCELLLERFEPGSMEYNDLKVIERHGLHCKSIVERLLSFARFSEERENICDVNENVRLVVSVTEHTLEMNDISLECSLDEDLPPVTCDPRGFQQVLLNLITNAVHALRGRKEKRISIRTRKKDDSFVEITVSDTGSGIPKHILPRIFDPFFTTKKVGEGTGLGLSVSYGIINQFGGSISCESIAEEDDPVRAGTTFTIILPTYREDTL
ncbi:MAG: ATP-binding protein [Syntrophobacterales bacterium]|nr:ATP-binding protein [Syntrophobacterales bacterium]